MSGTEKKKKKPQGRARFTILDILRAGRGIERPDGYVVLPQSIVDQVEDEIERLNEVEDELAALIDAVEEDHSKQNLRRRAERARTLITL